MNTPQQKREQMLNAIDVFRGNLIALSRTLDPEWREDGQAGIDNYLRYPDTLEKHVKIHIMAYLNVFIQEIRLYEMAIDRREV